MKYIANRYMLLKLQETMEETCIYATVSGKLIAWDSATIRDVGFWFVTIVNYEDGSQLITRLPLINIDYVLSERWDLVDDLEKCLEIDS